MPHITKFMLFVTMMLMSLFTVSGQESSQNTVLIPIESHPFLQTAACSGRFIQHELDHETTVPGGQRVRMFEANGGGVGINDLDDDGDLDIVLANHSGMNSILWNDGNLNFRTERMAHGDSRAVSIVDVDGDSQLDIVFSRTKSAPTYWHNDGDGHFTRQFLSGVGQPLYAINWADFDHDSDLDLVGATYDASLLTDYGQAFLTSGNGGVFYYENRDGHFQLNTLATKAQALALLLIDLNSDGHLDIWVGNDFALPDQIWYWSQTGWQEPEQPPAMSYSTMSLDFGDVDNDGQNEIYSTDMKPFDTDLPGDVALREIIDGINAEPHPEGDTQITANTLQSVGSFTDWADLAGVDTTGWSWSGKFGDLDMDGFLDLYVVNGFIEISTFAQLPNQELIQENQVFRNEGNRQFMLMPEWGLGSTRSGRGMSMADLDGDSDLDIVVNNLSSAAELFENRLCTGYSLQVDLRWPGSGNTHAIGATLTLHTDEASYSRDVKAVSGYISGDPSRIHFGFPANSSPENLEIRWPDGEVSTVDAPAANSLLVITRNQ